MAERDIVRLGDPMLWTPSAIVHEATQDKVQQTLQDLDDTLARFRTDTGWGRGISAVQIGDLTRITFVRLVPDEWKGNPGIPADRQRSGAIRTFAFLNPQIVERSKETIDLWDDCFSFPNLMVRVRRNYRIAVRYQEETGRMRELEAEGGLSELLQHEFDHLDGILAIDRRLDDRSFRYNQSRTGLR